ncbi:MAG: hypothetical protein A3J29_06300 [Acidobacteria bacterium RIFCSPLOWO2_12_FULL_67_14b]|nr:MAG: hypothetical protein A3J29_06300 [Acidobacteria bacterium RIFCSPLOWO2_12_FULL_67_14b]
MISMARPTQLAAIAAIAEGRYADAAAILDELRAEPAAPRPGVCRFCGCSEARACGILSEFETLIRCGWADAEATVCTNVSCLERWRREASAELDVEVHDLVEAAAPTSRIVLP